MTKTARFKSFSFCALSVALSFHCSSAMVMAQTAAPGPGGEPVDIQAEEQEFAEGQIIAKGHVKVTMKDMVVLAPMATLFRDATGTAQKAVFTGHPHLIQGANKIDANTLIFEMSSQKVIADGDAHSEVVQDEPPPPPPKDAKGAPPAKAGKTASGPGPAPKSAIGKNGEVVWPTKKSDAALANASTPPSPAPQAPVKDSMANDTDDDSKDAPVRLSDALKAPPSTGPGSAPAKPVDKIITDSDHQEYERANGRFEARGHVRVHHGDIFVKSETLKLVYGADNKPETALFNGNVNATQNDNNTQADAMTYYLSSQRLQASGHVRSKVIQKKPDVKKGGPDDDKETAVVPEAPDAVHRAIDKKPIGDTSAIKGIPADSNDPIIITSDAQDYSKETGRIAAEGNAKVYYGDTIGSGPKVVLTRTPDGDADKVIFTGRSMINQPGKRWIGDKITMNCADHRVLAEGNTRAVILQTNTDANGKPGAKGAPAHAQPGGSKLADKSTQL